MISLLILHGATSDNKFLFELFLENPQICIILNKLRETLSPRTSRLEIIFAPPAFVTNSFIQGDLSKH